MSNQVIAPAHRAGKKAQSRFQRLWHDAENMARDNVELEQRLDALVLQVSDEVGRAERALGDTVLQVVHRQLDFAEKKSLLKWQRAELTDWIDEHLTRLMDFGQLDDNLQNRLAQHRAKELGIELDESSDVSPADQLRERLYQDTDEDLEELCDSLFDEFDNAQSDEQLDEETGKARTPDSDEESVTDDELAELLRQLHEEFGTSENAGHHKQKHAKPSSSQRGNKPGFDDAVFKRLFRQTAAALHPDKETDQERQHEKHELMSQLLQARKERDLITIVRLHEQHSSAETTLSVEDEQQLEEVLVDYLMQQQQRSQAIVQRSPMHEFVFYEFYHKNPATIKRRLKKHIKKIDSHRAGLEEFVLKVKTLKVLKEWLADRYDQHRYDSHWF